MATDTTPQPAPAGNAPAQRRILVLDDELSIQRLLRIVLESEGHAVVTTDDGHAALGIIANEKVDLVIQDLRMPKMDGLTFLRLLKERDPGIPSIVLTAFGTFETAVEAMRLGAYTHLNKPFDTEEIRQIVARALERLAFARRSPRADAPFLDLIGNTPPMRAVASLVKRIGPTDSTVLISGESGTGKELVARAVHYGSLRADQPFVAVNCGAFTETLLESELFGHVKGAFTNAIADRKGVFESADRGTLFLDEVGELTPPTQVKLLRVLETRTFKPVGSTRDMRVDVRFITATNRNLRQMVEEGQFREDLYYRLNVIPVELPPLRERKDDIPLLAGQFLARFAKRMNRTMTGIDDAVINRLLEYSWPGNVRELENTIERAVALARGERITLEDLAGPVLGKGVSARLSTSVLAPAPPQLTKVSGTGAILPSGAVELPKEGLDLEKYLLDQERACITQALDRCDGSLTEAAKLLNMTFRSMRYRVSKLGIERPLKGEG
jgi:two-component system response regulator PilR (NtrC family)